MGPGENEPREPNTISEALGIEDREPNTIDLAEASDGGEREPNTFREPNTEN